MGRRVAGGRMIKPLGRTLIIGVVLALVTLTGLSPASAVYDDPDVDTSADYTYTVKPDTAEVEVRIEVAVTGDKPNRTVSGGYYQYYLTNYFISIPSEAEDLAVSDQSETELEFTRSVGEVTDVLDISLRRNVYYRQTTNLVLTFTLLEGERGSDDITRVNEAYTSFFAWTSPEIEDASITVVTPDGFVDYSDASTPFVSSADAGEVRHVADDIDPETYFAVVSMADDESLASETVSLEDFSSDIVVSYWPGDEVWRDHAVEAIEHGVPLLIELTGLSWPITGQLDIRESNSTYLTGYAGWYDSSIQTIEVGDELEDHVLFHELSHVWFDDNLFTDRWITEGLAEVFAVRAVEASGDTRPELPTVAPSDRNAIALDTFELAYDSEAEAWAYQASWSLMEHIVDEVGFETLVEIIGAADERRFSYVGDRDPEVVTSAADWRRFLDLLENEERADEGVLAELFDTWVVSNEVDSRSLELRAEARTSYQDLVHVGDTWAAPAGVRDAMTVWDFAEADELMNEASAILADRDQLRDVIGPTAAELPVNLEVGFEYAADDFDEVTAEIDDAADAGAELREAHDRSAADHSLIERLGLVGTDLATQNLDAVAAFERGELDEAIAQANEVDALIDGAGGKGLLRGGTGLALFLAVVAAMGLIVRHLRGQASSPNPLDPALAPTHSPSGAPKPDVVATAEVEPMAEAATPTAESASPIEPSE